jgi:hypothetical protein
MLSCPILLLLISRLVEIASFALHSKETKEPTAGHRLFNHQHPTPTLRVMLLAVPLVSTLYAIIVFWRWWQTRLIAPSAFSFRSFRSIEDAVRPFPPWKI